MPDQNSNPPAFQFLRGNESQNARYTGPEGSVSYDKTNKKLRLHDGVTQGGHSVGLEDTQSTEAHHVRINDRWVPIQDVLIDYGTMDNWVTLPKYIPGQEAEGGIYVGTYTTTDAKQYHLFVSKTALTDVPVEWSTFELVTDATSEADLIANMEKLNNLRWGPEEINSAVDGNVTAISFFGNLDGKVGVYDSNVEEREWAIIGYSDKPPRIYRTVDWSLVVELTDFPVNPTSLGGNHYGSFVAGYAEAPYLVLATFNYGTTAADPITYEIKTPLVDQEVTEPVFDIMNEIQDGEYYFAVGSGVYELTWSSTGYSIDSSAYSEAATDATANGPFTRGRLNGSKQSYALLSAVMGNKDYSRDNWWDWSVKSRTVAGDAIASTGVSTYDAPVWSATVHTAGNKYTVFSVDKGIVTPLTGYPALGDGFTPVDCDATPDGQYLLIATAEAPYLVAVNVGDKTLMPVNAVKPIKRVVGRLYGNHAYLVHTDGTLTELQLQRPFTETAVSGNWVERGYDPATEWTDPWTTQVWKDKIVDPYYGRVWDLATLQPGTPLDPLDSKWATVMSNDGQYVATNRPTDANGQHAIYNVDTLAVTYVHSSVPDVTDLWVAFDGKLYAFDNAGTTWNGNIPYDVETGTPLDIGTPPTAYRARSLTPTLIHLIRGETYDDVIWDAQAKAEAFVIPNARYNSRSDGPYFHNGVPRNHRYAVFTGDYGDTATNEFGDVTGAIQYVAIFDTETKTILWDKPVWGYTPYAIVTGDGEHVVVASEYDVGMPIYHIESGEQVGTIPAMGAVIGTTPENELVVAANESQMWNNRVDRIKKYRLDSLLPAANAVAQYTEGHHNDWQLPSTTQLDQIKTVMPDHMVGAAWASREVDAANAYTSEGTGSKTAETHEVYAVRAFEVDPNDVV